MMNDKEMKALLIERGNKIEAFLPSCVALDIPPRLKSSMLYSLQAGGKRLRPVLCLSCAALCGEREEHVLPFAAALEMIHTYSLIHDDLPAMDDDDLRRGKPSNHKAFDEATAILAGDALLTDAFFMMTTTSLPPERLLAAIRTLAHAAGASGMVGGQALDMAYTGMSGLDISALQRMHAMKTGALLQAACVCGALLAGAKESIISAISHYGAALGVAFQIADDILDVVADTATLGKPAGSDAEQGKNTYPALLGLEESRRLAREQANRACAAIEDFSGNEADFLRALAQYTVTRAS